MTYRTRPVPRPALFPADLTDRYNAVIDAWLDILCTDYPDLDAEILNSPGVVLSPTGRLHLTGYLMGTPVVTIIYPLYADALTIIRH